MAAVEIAQRQTAHGFSTHRDRACSQHSNRPRQHETSHIAHASILINNHNNSQHRFMSQRNSHTRTIYRFLLYNQLAPIAHLFHRHQRAATPCPICGIESNPYEWSYDKGCHFRPPPAIPSHQIGSPASNMFVKAHAHAHRQAHTHTETAPRHDAPP
jgi:hypothetical protein